LHTSNGGSFGGSGLITLQTGESSFEDTGEINIVSGYASQGSSGNINISNGLSEGKFGSHILIASGETRAPSGHGGNIMLSAGDASNYQKHNGGSSGGTVEITGGSAQGGFNSLDYGDDGGEIRLFGGFARAGMLFSVFFYLS